MGPVLRAMLDTAIAEQVREGLREASGIPAPEEGARRLEA